MVFWKARILRSAGLICVLAAISFFPYALKAEPKNRPPANQRLSQAPKQTRAEENLRFWQASALMGMRLENLNGQRLGALNDFALDMRSGQVRYAIVSSGGALGVRKEVRAMPPQFISGATAKRQTLAANLTMEQWKNAPTFRLRDLPKLAGRQQAGEIEVFYAKIPPEPLTDVNHPPVAVATPLKPTGRSHDGQRDHDQPPELELASRVIGKDVTNHQEEDIGQVSDLLLDLSAPERVFAIVSTGRFLRRHESYAVPFRALSQSLRGKKLLIDADRGSFGQAPPLTRDAWNNHPAPGRPKVFRYDERNPLNR